MPNGLRIRSWWVQEGLALDSILFPDRLVDSHPGSYPRPVVRKRWEADLDLLLKDVFAVTGHAAHASPRSDCLWHRLRPRISQQVQRLRHRSNYVLYSA